MFGYLLFLAYRKSLNRSPHPLPSPASVSTIVSDPRFVLALDLEGVHDVKLHHPSSSVATSNQ